MQQGIVGASLSKQRAAGQGRVSIVIFLHVQYKKGWLKSALEVASTERTFEGSSNHCTTSHYVPIILTKKSVINNKKQRGFFRKQGMGVQNGPYPKLWGGQSPNYIIPNCILVYGTLANDIHQWLCVGYSPWVEMYIISRNTFPRGGMPPFAPSSK